MMVCFATPGLDEDEALRVTLDTLRLCAAHDGLLVVNTHPVGLREHLGYYERLLKAIAENSAYEVVCPGELAARLDAANRAGTKPTAEAD